MRGRSAVRGPAFSTVTSNARRPPESFVVFAVVSRFVRSSVSSPAPSASASGSVIGSIVSFRPRWISAAVRRSGSAVPSGGR